MGSRSSVFIVIVGLECDSSFEVDAILSFVVVSVLPPVSDKIGIISYQRNNELNL
jgi:hypothetical protein